MGWMNPMVKGHKIVLKVCYGRYCCWCFEVYALVMYSFRRRRSRKAESRCVVLFKMFMR